MAGGEERRAARYSAFISYSHVDARFTRSLHRRLEGYVLPRRLGGASGAIDPKTRRLKPLFRDRDELPAAADLPRAVEAALADSAHLIVVCSPSSAASTWVAREVEAYRRLHGGGEGILAAAPDGVHAQSLSPALKGGDGAGEPLAADFSALGDGPRLALLKLVAALAGVGLDALVRRDGQRRWRRLALLAALVAGVALVLGALAVFAFDARAAAERERARGGDVVAAALAERQRLKSVGRLDLLAAANRTALSYFRGVDPARLSDAALLQRSAVLQAMGEDDEKRGQFSVARDRFDEAKAATTALLRAHPDAPDRIYAQAQSEYWSGFICWRLNDSEGARRGFEAYAALARRLVRMDPRKTEWLVERGYAESNLGSFLLRRWADTTRAEPQFRAALADFEAAGRRRPDDADLRLQIADGYAWLADVHRIRGDYADALALRIRQRALLQAELDRNLRDASANFAISSNTLAIARIALARRNFADALMQIEKGQTIARSLKDSDRENSDYRKQDRIFQLFRVETWLDMTHYDRLRLRLNRPILGSCANDIVRLRSAELAGFCNALGHRERTRTVAELSQPHKLTGARDALSERWRLDRNQQEP